MSVASDLIRDCRKMAGLTQAELGERLGLTQSAIAKLERADSNPTVDTLARVLEETGHKLQLLAPSSRQSRGSSGGGSFLAMSLYPTVRYDDARAAIAFLTEAFGFEVKEIHDGPDGKVEHAELAHGGHVVMVGTEVGEGPYTSGPVTVYVVVEDADAAHDRAKAAGAEIVAPLADQDYGSRDFAARDPGGHVWAFGTYRPEV